MAVFQDSYRDLIKFRPEKFNPVPIAAGASLAVEPETICGTCLTPDGGRGTAVRGELLNEREHDLFRYELLPG